MKYTKHQEQIIKLFESTANHPLSYNEIVVKADAGKKEKALLKQAITYLYDNDVLIKDKKKYRLKDYTVTQDAAPATGKQNPNLLQGKFDATPLSRNQSYAFVRTSIGDFFVSSEDTLNAYHNDVVTIQPFFKGDQPDYCKVSEVVERANRRMAGDISRAGGKDLFVCNNPKVHNWFQILDSAGAVPGKKVIFEVSNWGLPKKGIPPAGKVVEILGDSGDPHVELLAVINQYQLPLEFPEAVIAELDNIEESISESTISQRRDLRDLFTFTIDPASAKDYDDAISIQRDNDGWKLWVHIADVAHYLALDSEIFIEAAKRGNSFYFPKKVIPMLPEKLSNGVCSLRPNEEKLVMTVYTEFDPNGRVRKQEMFEAVIKSNFRLAYEQVDVLFEGGTTELDPQLQQVLFQARGLSRILTEKRMQAGYIFFDLPEIEYEYDEEGFLHELSLAEETESHKLIENFMLVANEFSAEKLSKLAPFSMYRIHEDPDPEKLERLYTTLSAYGISPTIRENPNKSLQALLYSLPGKDYHRVFDRIILRSMKKAKYSTEHIRHFGLSMENYTHFTSPIRRLCDLLIHHLCKQYILGIKGQRMSYKQMVRYAEIASEQELLANEAEREIERIYKLAYLKDKVGEKFSGIVIATNSSGLIIRLNEIPVTAVLKTSQFISKGFVYMDKEMRHVNKRTGYYYQLVDKVKVQIIEVSDDVYLEFTNDDDCHIHTAEQARAQSVTKIKSSRPKNKEIDSRAKSKKRGYKSERPRKNKKR